MNLKKWVVACAGLFAFNLAMSQDKSYPKAKVSFEDFKSIVAQVEPHRASRLIDLDTFLKMSKEKGAIVLDARSTFRYERIHLKGAKHLSFNDFTQANLGAIIPSFDTKILIYCNNNFEGNQRDFASKIAQPIKVPNSPASEQFASQEKPLMMALNIPTYINLFGYGYRNVYELDELVNVSDPRITFEGSIVGPSGGDALAPPVESLNTARSLLDYIQNEEPDIGGDLASQKRFLSENLRTALLTKQKMCAEAVKRRPADKIEWPSNGSLLLAWEKPSAYEVIGSRRYGDMVFVDVEFNWGTGTNYPGNKRIQSYIFISEKGQWKLDDVYHVREKYAPPGHLIAELLSLP